MKAFLVCLCAIAFSCASFAHDDPAEADADYAAALQAFEDRHCQLAERLVKQVVAKYPKSSSAYVLQGEVLNSIRRFSEAETAFMKAGKYCRRSARTGEFEARMERGLAHAYEGLGRLAEARAAIDRAIVANDSSFVLYEERAILNERLGYMNQACDDYTSCLKLNPSYADGYCRFANYFWNNGERKKAIDKISEGYNNTNASSLSQAKIWTDVYRGRSIPAVNILMGNYMLNNNDGLATKVERAFPARMGWELKAKFRNDPYEATWHILNADILFNKGRFEDALAEYRTAQKFATVFEPFTCHDGVLDCMLAMRRLRQARQLLTIEYESDTSSYSALDKLCDVNRNLGLDYYDYLARLASQAHEYNLRQFVRSGYDDMVRLAIEKASLWVLEPSPVANLLALRAVAYELIGDSAAAEQDARECLEEYDKVYDRGMTSRSNAQLAYSAVIAHAILRHGDEEAGDACKNAAGQERARGEYFYSLACLKARQGRADDAVALIDSAYRYGFYDTEWLMRDPLLASARGSEAFRSMVARHAHKLDDEPEAVVTRLSVPCSFEHGLPKMRGVVNGFSMDVYYNDGGIAITISEETADFLAKNGKLRRLGEKGSNLVRLDEVRVGDLVIKNVKAVIMSQSEPVLVDGITLRQFGFSKTDRRKGLVTFSYIDF